MRRTLSSPCGELVAIDFRADYGEHLGHQARLMLSAGGLSRHRNFMLDMILM